LWGVHYTMHNSVSRFVPVLATLLLFSALVPQALVYAGGFKHHRGEHFRAWLQTLSTQDQTKYRLTLARRLPWPANHRPVSEYLLGQGL